MYIHRMKRKHPNIKSEPLVLRDDVAPLETTVPEQNMVRTQIYLTRAEHEFLQSEAARRNQPMAALIRGFIDEKMQPSDELWSANSLLAEPASAPGWAGHEDGSLNHDSHVYGGSPAFKKVRGKWVRKSAEEP